jgi:hypothetical protein
MLAQFGCDRVGHDLTAMSLGQLVPVDRRMPTRLGIAVDGYPEVAGADPLRHDFFDLGSGLLLLTHARLRTSADDGATIRDGGLKDLFEARVLDQLVGT